MKMNLRPCIRYQFTNYLKGIGVIFLVLIMIPSILLIIFQCIDPDDTFKFTGFIIIPTIFMFVTGIVAIRSDLRFSLQYGTSRRTAFFSEILSILSACILLAGGVEIIKFLFQLFIDDSENYVMSDLYQMIYLGMDTAEISFKQHLISILYNISLVFSAAFFGMFFSLVFWRLSKTWTVIVAISIPFVFVLVILGSLGIYIDLEPFINWLNSSPFRFMLTCLAFSILFEIFNWLLLRRANIMAAKS